MRIGYRPKEKPLYKYKEGSLLPKKNEEEEEEGRRKKEGGGGRNAEKEEVG